MTNGVSCCHHRSRLLLARTFPPAVAAACGSPSYPFGVNNNNIIKTFLPPTHRIGWIVALAATLTTNTREGAAWLIPNGTSRKQQYHQRRFLTTQSTWSCATSKQFDSWLYLNSIDRTTTTTARYMSSNIDEVERAKAAAATVAAAGVPNSSSNDDTSPPTIFDKIIAGHIPCQKLFEDDVCLAFFDVNPQAPTHFLVIPKQRQGLTQLSRMQESQKELVGHLMYVAQRLGQEQCPQGFRLVINDGSDGSQSVYHLHIHVLGGRQMLWPPG